MEAAFNGSFSLQLNEEIRKAHFNKDLLSWKVAAR